MSLLQPYACQGVDLAPKSATSPSSALDTETVLSQYLRNAQKGSLVVKLSGLIDGMCRLTAFPHGTVALAARHLREAGLISSGGRGPGAANMTYTDATNLLLGVAGAMQVVEAVDVVRFGREAKHYRGSKLEEVVELPFLDPMAPLGETLDALLRRLGEHEDVLDLAGDPVTLWLEINRTGHDLSFNAALLVDSGIAGSAGRYEYHRNNPEFEGLAGHLATEKAHRILQTRGYNGIQIKCSVDEVVIYGLADLISGRKGVDELWPVS